MRFAMVGMDRSLDVFEAFVDAGWTPLALFTHAPDELNPNAQMVRRAHALGLPVQSTRLVDGDLARLAGMGCDALVVCYYPWRIGAWQAHLRYAVNFHPSPLPRGRGPFPWLRAIIDGETEWGVSCHRITDGFDEGAVLAQLRFALDTDETVARMHLKTALAFCALARDVAVNFEARWHGAIVQSAGDYTPTPRDEERTLDWQWPVQRVLASIRAFGAYGVLAQVGDARAAVRDATGWTQAHDHAPGSVLTINGSRVVVAVPDGYIGLLDWQVLA